MARVSTYLNFTGNAREAFAFYKDVFGGEDLVEPTTFGDMPADPNMPQLSEEDLAKTMHAEVSILDGHVLMATDMLESMGHERRIGNNVTINLEPDTRAETERLYGLLAEGASDATGLMDMPFGYWGTCLDRFGIRWMFNCAEPAA